MRQSPSPHTPGSRAGHPVAFQSPAVVLAWLAAWATPAVLGADACRVDVACEVAGEWRAEARAVARLVVSGKYLCTGTLVNNTAGDGTPYLLTAHHCVPDEAAAQSVVVYWNYANSGCDGSGDGRLDQAQAGATLVATDPATDISLLKLHERPRLEYRVFYAGWDRRESVASGVATIHHASGQEKTLSLDFGPLVTTSAFAADVSNEGDFLMVEGWDLGTTGPGSSGAGLWNSEHRLVGHLSGGYGSCSDSQPSWFGRLARAWDGRAGGHAALRGYLDPLGTGAETLDGMEAPGANLTPAPRTEQAPTGGGIGFFTVLGLLAGSEIARRSRSKPGRRSKCPIGRSSALSSIREGLPWVDSLDLPAGRNAT